MADFHNNNEVSFSSEEGENIVKECIEEVIGHNNYSQNQVNRWTISIVERCAIHLALLGKPYKYIVTCTLMQKRDAGLHLANCCYWDTAMDGSFRVKWQNRTMYCEVGVFIVTSP